MIILQNDSRIACLVINEKLDWVVAPFDEHNFISLARYAIRERRPYAWAGVGLDPHAERKGVHLWKGLGETAVQVVGSLGKGQLKLLWRLKVSSSCNKKGRKVRGDKNMAGEVAQEGMSFFKGVWK